MTEIDSLDIKISSDASNANKAINSLVKNLDKLSSSLKFDTSGFENIQKISGNISKSIEQPIKKVAQSLTDLQKKYADLGKTFEFKGSTQEIQKQIDKYTNALEKAKLKKQELELSGKTEGQTYENAVKDTIKYTNIIESLKNKLKEIQSIKPNIDFKISGIENVEKQITNVAEKIRTVSLPQSAFNYNADAMKAVYGEMASGIENWSQAIQQFGSNVGTVFNQAASNTENLKAETKDFEVALNSLKEITPQINETNIVKLQNRLKTVETQTEKLRYELEKGLRLGTIDDKAFDKLTIKIKESENQAELLKEKIKEVGNTSSQMSSGVRNFGDSIKSASNSILNMANSSTKAIRPLNNLGNSFRNLIRTILPILGIRQIFNWGKQATEIASDLTEVQNVVDVTFGNMAYKVEDFAKNSIEQFGLSELSLKEFSSRFQAMGTAMGFPISQMSEMSVELTKLTADMSSFYNVTQEDVAKSLESIFTGTTMPLRKYGLDLTQATLQEWALKQGIDADIQSMSQAEKTMLRYQYVLANTGAAQGDFARTADTWANQLRILRQNFEQLAAVIGRTFINALKPLVKALNAAMSHIISFAKTISNALGKIFGWTFEEGGGFADDFGDAAGSADDIADSTGTAAKNIKKMQAGLRAFDELKVINMPDNNDGDGGAGGTGGLGGAGGAIGGNWIQGDSLLKQYESEIDTLYKLGEYIGKTLTDAMNSIDWDSVYEKARNFGKGLADFLNGLISPDLFGALGRTIAGALNTAVYAALSFGETFDWKDFGLSIATGINNFFATFDFAALAQTINVWAKSILDTAITAVENTDWGMIGEQIGTFFSTIDIMEILGKIVALAKKAAKAFTNAWVGAFKKAPLETLLISLLAIPKALKAIISSKFITGIAKIASNFVKFGKNTLLVTSALAGNRTALAALSTNYPRFGKAVDVARQAFANFRFGIENGNIFTGLNEGIKTIRNNLTGLQKGAITAVAGFAEFKIVSSTFEGLTLGTENVVSGLGKIGIAVAAAGAAMYVALGPAGLAIAAITGVVAAVKGINDAFDAIRAQEIGETIKNAMSNPGGVPLSEITSNFANALSEAATGFDAINEKSSEMKSVQKNIENTWTEIYKIQEAMENGVLSVEEGKEQLETLFSELATLTEQKFSTMNTVIMSAYGEGGSFRTALENMGADTELAIDTMITYGYQNSERAKEIAQELAGMDINSEEYKTLNAELASLTGEMSKFEQATSNFAYDMNSLQGKIDYSEIFLPDGSIDTEALQSYLNEATTALSDYETSLDDAGKEISQYWQEIYNSTTATDEQKAVAQANLEYIPQAIESMKKDAELQIVGFTDTMQNEFLARTSQIIDDSITEWESKNAFEKWWNGIWGAGTKGEYVKEAVDQQQANIEEVSSAIEESLGSLQTEGVVWANDAAKEIYGALFDSEYIHSEVGIGHYKYTLNEDYREVIEGATEGIADLASERGKDAVDGYANGISDNTNTAESSAKTFVERVMEIIAKTQDSHSPSRVTKEFGKNAVEGYNLGISENQNSTFSKISEYTRRILEKLSEIISPFRQIGLDAMYGLQNGLSSMEGSLYAKAQSIAQNIANTIKNALDIHSPSRVMFELGDYTMQGFRNGLENLYKPIISSAKMFSRDLQVASTPNINDMYGGYQSQTVYTPQYNITEHAQSGYNQSNAETNALLREILSAIKEGKTITIGQDEVGKVSMRYIQEEERRLQKSLVGIY